MFVNSYKLSNHKYTQITSDNFFFIYFTNLVLKSFVFLKKAYNSFEMTWGYMLYIVLGSHSHTLEIFPSKCLISSSRILVTFNTSSASGTPIFWSAVLAASRTTDMKSLRLRTKWDQLKSTNKTLKTTKITPLKQYWITNALSWFIQVTVLSMNF